MENDNFLRNSMAEKIEGYLISSPRFGNQELFEKAKKESIQNYEKYVEVLKNMNYVEFIQRKKKYFK